MSGSWTFPVWTSIEWIIWYSLLVEVCLAGGFNVRIQSRQCIIIEVYHNLSIVYLDKISITCILNDKCVNATGFGHHLLVLEGRHHIVISNGM